MKSFSWQYDSPELSGPAAMHMLFVDSALTLEQRERMCWGLGTFHHPAAPLAQVLRDLGYFTRPRKVVTIIDDYQPRMNPHHWSHIRSFVIDSVSATGPLTERAVYALLSPVEWMTFVKQLPLDGNVVWSKQWIDRYVNSELLSYAAGTRANYRKYLDRVREAVQPQELDYQYIPQNRHSSVAPYTPEEILGFRDWAAYQSTDIKRTKAMMTMVFCTGAGLRAHEVGQLQHQHITHTGNGYLIDIDHGSAPRRVPLLASWDDWLEVILDTRPTTEPLWGTVSRLNENKLISAFTQYSEGNSPRADRLRNTWLLTHLRNRVPMTDLFYAAGVRKMEHLGRLIKHLPPLDAVEFETLFRGEVTR